MGGRGGAGGFGAGFSVRLAWSTHLGPARMGGGFRACFDAAWCRTKCGLAGKEG